MFPKLWDFIANGSDVQVYSAFALFWIVLAYCSVLVYRKLKGRGRHVSERRILADEFTNLIEDLVHRRKISRDRADWMYKQLETYVGLEGVTPMPLRGVYLKAAIRQRLYGSLDYYRPVPLPDRKRSLEEFFSRAPW